MMKMNERLSTTPFDRDASIYANETDAPVEQIACDRIENLFRMGFDVDLSWNGKALTRQFTCHLKRNSSHEDMEPVSRAFHGDGYAEVIARACKWAMEPAEPPMLPLDRALADCLNRQSAENGSNTPDFILGSFLSSVLCAMDAAIASRDKWYGVKLEPGQHRCREYDWENGERVTINVGAIFKIGKRLWRLKGLPGEEQGEDMWHFESTEPESEMRGGCPFDRMFTRSELQWLYSHGSFVGQPVDAPGAVL